jgi:hypothetical protein
MLVKTLQINKNEIMIGIEKKVQEFKNLPFPEQMSKLYEKLLLVESKENSLPPEITDRMYTISEAKHFIKMSDSWIRQRVYNGTIEEKTRGAKIILSWDDIQLLIQIRDNKGNE